MMVGYQAMEREIELGRIYLESNNNPSAWVIWEKGATKLEKKPQAVVPPSSVAEQAIRHETAEQLIERILRGDVVSPETRHILEERFGITSSELAKSLTARLRESGQVKKVLEILGSGLTISEWMRQNKQDSGYAEFERETLQLGIAPGFDGPGLEVPFGVDKDTNTYKLVLSERNADDLVRGYISGDCTNPSWAHARHTFNEYIPEHLLKPGFLNFKVYRTKPHAPSEWIGNVYAAILRQNDQSVLLIDAIQVPWAGLEEKFGMQLLPLPPPYNRGNPTIPFPVKDLREAEKISDAIIAILSSQYALKYGFKKTYLGFGSNFTPLVEHFYSKYASNYNNVLPPSEAVRRSQVGEPVVENISRTINQLSEREYLSRFKSLKFELVGLDKEKLDSFPNKPYTRRGFAEIPQPKINHSNTTLVSIVPVLGYVALTGWLIYLGYRGVKWLVNRYRQNHIPRGEDASTALMAVENVHIAEVVSDGILEKKSIGALLSLTEEERASIQLRLGSVVDRVTQGSIATWPQTFIKAFKEGKVKALWELPLPVPVGRIRRESSPRNQAIMILRLLKIWMDGADSRVIRDLRRGVEEARESVTEEALGKLDRLSDEQLLELLTTEYHKRFGRGIEGNMKRFVDHVRRFQGPSPEERGLNVSPDIQSRYERLPRYLKWIFTQNPGLDNDSEMQSLIKVIYDQMMQLPTFSAEIESFAKDALSESIRLNPELGLRLFEYLSRDLPSQEEMLLRLSPDQARPSYPTTPQLEATQIDKTPRPALPDPKQAEEAIKRQVAMLDSLKQALEEFKAKLARCKAELLAKERDLHELTEAHEDAKRSGENYTADVIRYAKEGAEDKVRHLKKEIASLEEKEKAYQSQINELSKGQSGKGITLYSGAITGIPLLLSIYEQVKELLVQHGFPNRNWLIIPFLLISPWLIKTTIKFLFRNIFPAKSDAAKVRNMGTSVWLIGVPLLTIIYLPYIIRPWSLMGREGLYSYWEAKKPAYYRTLKEEMKGLAKDFRKPGEKFRVAYDRKNVDMEPSLIQDPIKDGLATTKDFLRNLFETEPDFYKKVKNIIYGKRSVPEYRELFEIITSAEINEVMTEVITRVQNWDMPNEKRSGIMLAAIELAMADKTHKLRKKIFGAKELSKKARLNVEYWQKILDFLRTSDKITKNSKVASEATVIINKRLSFLGDQSEMPRLGLMQFYLSGVTFTDFFSGFISNDCTANMGMHFFDFLTTKLDPAFMLFKIIENGRWVGNLYAIVLKDSGNEVILLDSFQLNMQHPLLNASGGQLNNALETFLERFKSYLSQQGFKSLLLNTKRMSSRDKIQSAFTPLAERQGAPVASNFKKPGGSNHRLNMHRITYSFLQALGNIHSDNVSFSGHKIMLPKTIQEGEKKKKEEEIEKLQQKTTSSHEELKRTEALLKETQDIFQQLHVSLEKEKQKNREASVKAILERLPSVTKTITGYEEKIRELRSKISQDEKRLEDLKRSLGLAIGGKKVGKGGKAAIVALLAFGFLLSTSKVALGSTPGAYSYNSSNPIGILLVFGIAAGVLYILCRGIKKWFRVARNGCPDIEELMQEVYRDKVNKQLRDGGIVLNPRAQEQADTIRKIADEFAFLFHPKTEDADDLAFTIIEKIKSANLDRDTKDKLMTALSAHLSWAKERIRFIKKLRFVQKDTPVNQRRLVEKLSEYLGIPSKSCKEGILKDYIITQLKEIGGAEHKMEASSFYRVPNNLVWDISASKNYTGEPLRIGLEAHLDTGTHTPTLLYLTKNSILAKGKGKYAEAGLDDAIALAVIMEALEIIKEKQIPHPALRIIFTAEEESGAVGAHYLVRNHPEIFEDIDLLIPIDGPILSKKSPLAAKFINFGKPKERKRDPAYQAVVEAARKVSRDINAPEEFSFSAGDEQAYKEVEGLRIAHFRADYEQGHAEKDNVALEHLILLSEWVFEIVASLDKKPAPRPSMKKVAKEHLFSSISLLSQDNAKEDIAKVIANSGKLIPGMDFFIYEYSPRKRLLQFKYLALGRLTLTVYLAGRAPKYYEVAIEDESIFDASGNIFIMELLKSKTASLLERSGGEVKLSPILKTFAIPKDFNPEVAGLAVKDPNRPDGVKVIEFPYKGFVQLDAGSKGLLYAPMKRLIPFVHLGLKIELDRFGTFKGISLPNLYDLIKSRYNQNDVVLGFHTHPDEISLSPRLSSLDIKELRDQNTPTIYPLQLLIGKKGFNFFHHFQDETQDLKEITLDMDRLVGEPGSEANKNLLAVFNKWLKTLPLLVSGEKRFSAKGKGMFTLKGRDQLEKAILEAKQEGRGYLIWGNSEEWKDNREEYTPEINSIIGYLRQYPYVTIPGVGVIDISKTLSSSDIVLIQSRDKSPGLVVNDEGSYQVAFCDIIDNTIKVDAATYSALSYNYPEKVALLAHEGILLGAMKTAQKKNIPWTLKLAHEVTSIAEEYEIQITGRSSNGRGSRLDERIEEILGFDTPTTEMRISTMPETESGGTTTLDLEDRNFPEILENLRRLLESLGKDPSANLPARIEDFPPPIAKELRNAYLFRRVKGLPIDIDFLAVLAMFFSRVFPKHMQDLLKYHSKLFIYIIDNKRSTFGATLRGNTLYIQKTCVEDLIGRRISVKEIYQAIENKDRDLAVALFRIIIHEIGGGFFKLSHSASQELEQLFLSMLSKAPMKLSTKTEQEIRHVNATPDLSTLPRIDWAGENPSPAGFKIGAISQREFNNLPLSFVKDTVSELGSDLFSLDQDKRDAAAKALAGRNKEIFKENIIALTEERSRMIEEVTLLTGQLQAIEREISSVTEEKADIDRKINSLKASEQSAAEELKLNVVKDEIGKLELQNSEIQQKLESLSASKKVNEDKIKRLRRDIHYIEQEKMQATGANGSKIYANNLVNSVVIRAREAKKLGQKLIIGFDTSWIPGYKKGKLEHMALNPLIGELEKLEQRLSDLGLDNLIIVNKSGDDLAGELISSAEKTNTPLTNVVALARQSTVNSKAFDNLRSTKDEKKAFIAAINTDELNKYYSEHSEDSEQLYIRIVEMLSIALELSLGKEPLNNPLIISYDQETRVVIFMPKPEPIDFRELKNRYDAERQTIIAA